MKKWGWKSPFPQDPHFCEEIGWRTPPPPGPPFLGRNWDGTPISMRKWGWRTPPGPPFLSGNTPQFCGVPISGGPHIRPPPNPHFSAIFSMGPPLSPPSPSPHLPKAPILVGGAGTDPFPRGEGGGVESQPYMSHSPTYCNGGGEGISPIQSRFSFFFRCLNSNLGCYFPLRMTFLLFLGLLTPKLEQDIPVCILFAHILCFLTQN